MMLKSSDEKQSELNRRQEAKHRICSSYKCIVKNATTKKENASSLGFYLRGLARTIVVGRFEAHDVAMVTALGRAAAAAIMWSRRRRKKERFISTIRVGDNEERL
jgi:hypothetical protein